MIIRTDLALESKQYVKTKVLDGIICDEQTQNNIKTTRIKIVNSNGSKLLSKPLGTYVTIEYQNMISSNSSSVTALNSALIPFLPKSGTLLIAGLGNEEITADSLGPKCTDKIIATRHMTYNMSSAHHKLRFNYACIKTDVCANTGIEAAEELYGIVHVLKPDGVIIIDSLASRTYERLGSVIQISDSGIVPGSGVNNHRHEISRATLHTPVTVIGVPTVIDSSVLFGDIDFIRKSHIKDVFITSKNIDFLVNTAAQLISSSLNSILTHQINITDL